MHSKWGIIAVLVTLAAALLITVSISGCPTPPEEPVIIDDLPPEDIAPPGQVTPPPPPEESVTNEPTEGGEGAEIAPPEGEVAPAPDAAPADPATDAPPADAPAAGG